MSIARVELTVELSIDLGAAERVPPYEKVLASGVVDEAIARLNSWRDWVDCQEVRREWVTG